MRWRLIVVLLLVWPTLGQAAEQPTVRIGVLVDGPWENNEVVRQLTIEEVTTLTHGEFDASFPESAYLIGDWTYETASQNLERLLEDPQVDIIVAWGVLSSQAVCCYGVLEKPVVAPVILDPRLQGLPFEDGASGVDNLSYVEIENKIDEELGFFRQIVPFTRVYFLTSANFLEAIPELATRTFDLATAAGYEMLLVPVGDSVDRVLEALPEDTEAVYVWPQFHLSKAERVRLIEGLNERRIPSFSALNEGDVAAGMLATATADNFFPRLVRRVALNVQRILLGENAGEIPVLFSPRDQVKINMETARTIGVSPSWDILLEAQLLHPQESGLPTMSLGQAVSEAIEANLDLEVQRRAVQAAAQEIAIARAQYRPQIDASASVAQIDEDRAAASFGSQAERTTTGSLTFSQLLYSDPALANIRVQEEAQRSREEEFEAVRLDLAQSAASDYLNLLRSQSLVRIQRGNLELTRSNLELAEIRKTIGTANPAEVLRWENQIATDRKALVEAQADQRAAEIRLNRLLHRDLDQRFLTTEVSLDDPNLITGQDRFDGYTETPARFQVFVEFMVQEGLTSAPELRQFDALIKAQERTLTSARRAFWAPTVALQATLDEILDKDGTGSDSTGTSLGSFSIPTSDDSSWSVGLSASLPLYLGGSRRAQVVQAEEELTRLNRQLDSTAENIASRIRIGMEIARGSFAGIELSRQAADAARASLELVSDSYARGAVSILDLLDAQNAVLNSDQLFANAIYGFFVDLMEVQRATNRFDFFLTPTERDLWYERLEAFFEREGARALNAPSGRLR